MTKTRWLLLVGLLVIGVGMTMITRPALRQMNDLEREILELEVQIAQVRTRKQEVNKQIEDVQKRLINLEDSTQVSRQGVAIRAAQSIGKALDALDQKEARFRKQIRNREAGLRQIKKKLLSWDVPLGAAAVIMSGLLVGLRRRPTISS